MAALGGGEGDWISESAQASPAKQDDQLVW